MGARTGREGEDVAGDRQDLQNPVAETNEGRESMPDALKPGPLADSYVIQVRHPRHKGDEEKWYAWADGYKSLDEAIMAMQEDEIGSEFGHRIVKLTREVIE